MSPYSVFNLLLLLYLIQYLLPDTLEAICYKPEGHGFDSRLGHWIFQFT
jgi:hypothetical protein